MDEEQKAKFAGKLQAMFFAALARNQHHTAARGREPGLRLERGGQEVTLVEWGAELLAAFGPIAAALDAAHGSSDYSAALAAAQAGLDDASALPSAQVLAAMAAGHENSFVRFVRQQSLQARESLLALPFSAEQQAAFEAESAQSVQDQRAIEAADTLPFEQYREQYVSPRRLGMSG